MSLFLRLYRLLTPHYRRKLAFTLLLMLAGAAAEIVTLGAVLPFLALVVDPEGATIPAAYRGLLSWFGGSPVVAASVTLIIAAVVAAAVRLWLARATQTFALSLGHYLAAVVFGRTLGLPYSEHARRHSSYTINAVHQIDRAVSGLLLPAMQGVIAAVLALCIVAMLVLIHPGAAVAGAAATILTYLVISRMTRPHLTRNSVILARTSLERTRTVQEGLGGIRDIILGRSLPHFESRFRAADLQFRTAQADNMFIAGAPRFLVEAAAIVAIVLVTLWFSLQPGGFTKAIPIVGALALGGQRLLPLMQQIFNGWSQVQGNRHALRDSMDIIERPYDLNPAPAGSGTLPFERSLEFSNVGYSHPEDRFSLRNISFRIGQGEHVAIAGPTGAGKSTLVDLMMGLLEAETGDILVDGRTIRGPQGRATWQAEIAHVPQSVYLVDDSIEANIAFPWQPSEVDLRSMTAAIEAAQLQPLIETLPQGLNTMVGEHGVRLSGGQRQRIGIARALIRRPRLLVLDEATSALDEETEEKVFDALRETPGLTVVTVAHRASTLARADRLLRMEAGAISSPV